MIAMGLALGTGLFLGSSSAIKIAGPGAIVSYAIGSMIAAIIAACAGEMSVRHPVQGGFGTIASRYLNPFSGYITRWAYWSCTVPPAGAERVAAVADRLIIGVGVNPAKRGLIAPADRVDLIREATAHLTGVEVTALSGATMDEAARLGATLIVKGVRGAQDTDFEAPQAALNLELGGVDTWWIPTRPGLGHVSSSAVRELLGLKKDVSRYVPPAIVRYLTDNRQ